jgi:multiple sugar transport system permease protein
MIKREERWLPYLFLAPAILLLVIFRILPALSGFREALYVGSLSFTGARRFVGFENYAYLFDDPIFWKSLVTTLYFNLIVNPLQTILALLLGVLVNQRVRGVTIFRSVYLLPVAVSLNVTALVWGLMLDYNAGLVNGILVELALPRQPFLTAASHALSTIIGVVTWKGVPFWMIFFLAGLQGIPTQLLEAAAIDGASAVQSFFKVTLPLLKRIILFVLVADTVANFILFAPVYLMTRGGPELSTNLLMYEAYRRGFVYGDLGSSAAITSLLLIIVIVVVVVEFSFLRSE